MNGVTNSVLRMVEHLAPRGYEIHIITPIAGEQWHGSIPVTRLRSIPMPGYSDVAISLAGHRRLTAILRDFAPDVVHLASPFTLGVPAVRTVVGVARLRQAVAMPRAVIEHHEDE